MRGAHDRSLGDQARGSRETTLADVIDDMADPAGGYRVAADLEWRAADLEQRLATTEDELHRLQSEREHTLARARLRRGFNAVSIGGLGAVGGWVLGLLGYAWTLDVRWTVFAPFFAFVMALVCAWDPRDEP